MKCPECFGTSQVSWFYEDEMGNEYERDFDCPVCEGYGEIALEELKNVPGWEDYADDYDEN